MGEKILLIDGHSILNRAFYGLPLLTNSEGLHTNAVYGFLNIMFHVLDEEQAQYLAVAFDLSAPTFRHKMYGEYKGTRKSMPEELREQVPLMKEMLQAMGIQVLTLEGFEADDIIGTVSKRAEDAGLDVAILSGDRDLLQLASDKVCVRIPKTKQGRTEVEDYRTADVLEKYMVTPQQIIELKALMGDSSDNIPGIPGVGEKTAQKIISTYGTIENAYAHVDEITPNRARTSLADHYDLAQLSKELATIDRESPVDFALENARLDNIYTDAALELCRRLGFRNLLSRFEGRETAREPLQIRIIRTRQELEAEREKTAQAGREIKYLGISLPGGAGGEDTYAYSISCGDAPDIAVCLLPGEDLTEKEAAEFIGSLAASAPCICALGLKEQLPALEAGGISVADRETVGIPVPGATESDGSGETGTKAAQNTAESGVSAADASVAQAAQNSADAGAPAADECGAQASVKAGTSATDGSVAQAAHSAAKTGGTAADSLCICECRFFDAAVAAYLLNPLKGSYVYDEIAREFADLTFPSAEELRGKKKAGRAGDVRDEEMREKEAKCACYEAACAAACVPAMRARLGETGMLALMDEVEMPLVFTLYHMQQAGITVRGDELSAYGERLQGRIAGLETRIYEEAGETFNINSPKQLGTVLFEHLHLPFGKKTKTGYSTSADVLEKLSGDYPVVADILEYRQLTKLKSTYADGLAAFLSEDGRIHGKFHQTVTATGRISSADPNLQNIPVRTELGRELRRVFVPEEGCVFVDADYSQIELRVLAHMSGDEKLIEAYSQAQDIHAITASQVFHVPLDQVTPLERRNAKAVNFGIVYGISSFGLSQDLSITRKEAEEYINQYFLTYPGIKIFLDESVASAKENGYSVTLFGRRRPVPELRASNFMQRSFGERVAMNAPIQGTAADIIKIAMIRVDRRLRRECEHARLLLQIHDELLVEVSPEEQEKAGRILSEEMMHAAALRVALEIDMHTGASWYDAK